ncbi:alpha/beta-hydrolase [Lactifluus subvellereus]|nr:alpha/beta-hydrolase [Lactifluus subvellereus]
MSVLERPLAETFPRIIELPSGLKLEASLTHPSPVTELDKERGATAQSGKRLAVCLHPWARLGGNMNDPVLMALLRPLTHYLKYHVLRYNARGVGRSSGWKSFTGLQEAEDLRELLIYALKRLGDVRELALIGYSNGALTASLHPVLPAPLRTTHVLISYPLGPRGLLTAFRTRTYQSALEGLVRDPRARVLLCYGDADDFTGVEAYDGWAEALGKLAVERGGNGLEVVRIPGASHFWGGQAGGGLIEAVTQFLTQGEGDGDEGGAQPCNV